VIIVFFKILGINQDIYNIIQRIQTKLYTKMRKWPNLQLSIAIIFMMTLILSCGKKKGTESASGEDTTSMAGNQTTQQNWIDDSELHKLSNTWVDSADAGEVSSTWTEDAFADKLASSPDLNNSWVDESGETVYKKGDVPPEFVGGQQSLFDYLKANIKYPSDVEKGTVYVAFIIGEDGAVRDVRVYKGMKESMDKEARRLIEGMPLWDPGMVDGKPANVVYGLPIIFRP
jgi:protein TonB